MMIIMEMLTCTPHAFAKNMIIKDIRIDTASMLTVAPSGIVILEIWFGTPSLSSTQLLLSGMVAELEHVPNAFSAAGMIALKNFTGLVLPRMLTVPPYTINANPKNATYKIISCVASDTIVFVPFASTTGTIVQKTPIGVKYITVLMIFRHASLQESMTFNNFKGCVSLKTITFEKGSKLKAFTGGHDNNYKILGAFLDCKSLTTIEIPASVESLGTAFKGSSLRTITFEKGSKLKSITGGYQNKDNYLGALSDCKALTFIEIPASVETIEIAAFKGCSSLEMITFEKGSKLESISGVRDLGAFDGAINLTTVDMSECTQVKRIDEYTFYGNSNLRLFKIGTEIPPPR